MEGDITNEVGNDFQPPAIEKNRFEEDIKRRKDLLENIIETAPSIIVGLNPYGNITIFNGAAEDTAGYSKEEAMGKSFLSLLIPERHREDMRAYFHELIAGTPTYNMEKQIVTKNGDERLISWYCTAINDYEKGAIGGLYIGNDITEKEIMMKEIVQRNRELTVINLVGMTLSQSLDLDTILKNALDRALELLWSGGGAIFLLDEKGEKLVMRASKGISPESENAFKRVELSQGILGKVVQSNNPMLIGNFSLLPDDSNSALEKEGVNSFGIIPLRAKSEVIGVLVIGTRDSSKLTPKDIQVYTTISNQIGIAVDNARLFEKVSYARKEWEDTFNHISQPLAIIGKDHRVLKINDAFAKKVNVGPEWIIGRRCYDIFHCSKILPEKCTHEKILETKKPVSKEIYDPDSGMTTQVLCFPYFDKNGQLTGLMHVEEDITEKKEAENEIRYLKEFNENIVENLGDGLEVIGEDHKIQYMNKGLFNSMGKDVIGKTCHEVHFERDRPCEGCPIIKGIENMNVETIECHSPKGKTFLITHSPLKNQDGSYSAILLFKDITEKQRMESELIKAEKLASIGSLVTGIAHELNNDLACVCGHAEAILDEEEPEKIHDYTRDIINNALRASDFMSWLTRYSSSTLGQKMEPINLNDIIKQSLSVMRRITRFENVEVVTDLTEIQEIEGNPSDIQQLFINLITNSLHALNGKGKISISTRSFNGTVQTIFKDDGAGIPKENISRIFDPFHSTRNEDVNVGPEEWKRGLGMYVISTIIRNHDARVSVESDLGKGTTFIINFPHIEAREHNV